MRQLNTDLCHPWILIQITTSVCTQRLADADGCADVLQYGRESECGGSCHEDFFFTATAKTITRCVIELTF